MFPGYFLTFTRCYIFDDVTFIIKIFGVILNLQSAICGLQSAVCKCHTLLCLLWVFRTCIVSTLPISLKSVVSLLMTYCFHCLRPLLLLCSVTYSYYCVTLLPCYSPTTGVTFWYFQSIPHKAEVLLHSFFNHTLSVIETIVENRTTRGNLVTSDQFSFALNLVLDHYKTVSSIYRFSVNFFSDFQKSVVKALTSGLTANSRLGT